MSKEIKELETPVFQVIAEVGKVETQAEGGLKMTVYTNEVAPDEMAMLMGLRGKQGNMLFAPASHKFTEEDTKDLPEITLEVGEKHPSTRLRAVLFRLWEQTGGLARPDKKTSEQYYREQMERIINQAKEKLEP